MFYSIFLFKYSSFILSILYSFFFSYFLLLYIYLYYILYIFSPYRCGRKKKAFHCVAHYVWLGMRQIQNLIGFEMYNHGMTGLPSDTAPHSLARPAGNLHAESSNKNRTNKKRSSQIHFFVMIVGIISTITTLTTVLHRASI